MKKTLFLLLTFLSALPSFSQCACCAGAGIGSSNGDYNHGILTLPKKKLVLETYADYRNIKEGNAPEEDESLLRSMYISSVGVRYGISNKLTVSALLPYVFLNTNDGSDSGVGDLIALGTYSVYAKNSFNLAVRAGIEFPTGIKKNSSFDNTIVVIGSGSVDPMIGVAVSKSWDKLALTGNGLYKYTTNGFEGNYYGSLAIQSLTLSYKIKENTTFCGPANPEKKTASDFGMALFGGYYGEWLDKIEEEGIVDEDSGHYLGFLTLGGNASYKSWAFPLTLSLPLINEMNGAQNNAGMRLRFGIIKSF